MIWIWTSSMGDVTLITSKRQVRLRTGVVGLGGRHRLKEQKRKEKMRKERRRASFTKAALHPSPDTTPGRIHLMESV